MDIHRFEKAWLGVSVLLILGLISSVVYGAVGPGIKMVDDSGGTLEPEEVENAEGFSDPGVRKTGENTYDVYVVAQQFVFRPGSNEPIQLPAGSTVTFHVTSSDVVHGFEIAGTNVNIMAIPGQVATVTVRFDEPATYGLICHEYCGSGHHTMGGTIEIVPQSEYDEAANVQNVNEGEN